MRNGNEAGKEKHMNDNERFKAQHEESMAVLNAMIAKLDASRATKDGLLGEISKLHMNSFQAGIAANRAEKEFYSGPATEYDSLDQSSFSSMYEVTARNQKNETFRCVLEACRTSEAQEIFYSLPGTNGMLITDVKRIMHGIYWIQY